MLKTIFKLFFILTILDIISIELVSSNVTTAQVSTTHVPTTHVPTTHVPIDFEKAKNEIISNIKKNTKYIKNLTEELSDVWQNETKLVNSIYKNLTDSIKWFFVAPEEPETVQLDKSLAEFFPLGGQESAYVDTIEKMDEYCKHEDTRMDALKSWVRRQFRYNIIAQVTSNLIFAKISEKNDYYCNTTAHKENYIKNIKAVKQINDKLKPVKDKMIDTLVFVQNSSSILPKVGRVCCAFWEFKKTLTEAVKSSEAVDFTIDMMHQYFGGASKYLCFLYPCGSSLCVDEEKAPKMPHKYESLILEMVITLGEIVTIF